MFKTSMLRSYFCDYSDLYIVVKGTIDLLAAAANENDKVEKYFAFKNNAPFRSCISNINIILIDKEADLDDVDDNASDGKLFKYKTKIVGNAPKRPGNEGDVNRQPVPTLHIEVTIPLLIYH